MLHTLPRLVFFFNDTAATEIYPLSLHDALPIWPMTPNRSNPPPEDTPPPQSYVFHVRPKPGADWTLHGTRSEEHTSELQSHSDLVCRLLLDKKKKERGWMAPGHSHDVFRAVHPH